MTDLSADTVREIESVVTDWRHDNDVPGVSVVLVDGETERYAEGFGARDLGTNAPATPDTLYGMGSITKPVTALAVAQLADAGSLSLDDPVDAYVDHLAEAPGDPITIRELLSHTSGMPASDLGLVAQSIRGVPAGVADEGDRERLVREATEHRVTEGDRFMYYNTGYDLLGRVIEAVDGREYADYVRGEVLDPLGMDRSTFHRDAFEADDDAMTGYTGGDGDDPPDPSEFPFEDLIHPSGGLLSSVRELSQFLRAAMAGGTFDGTRIWPEGAVERFQKGRAVRQTYLDGAEEQYGYGWMRQPLAGDEVVGHGGSILVSTAYAGHLVDEGLGIVAACNASGDPHVADLAHAVLAIAVGREPTAVPTFALARKAEAVTGTYEDFRGNLTATVEREGGGVSVTLSAHWGEQSVTAFPVTLDPDDHEFYTVEGVGARANVEFDLDGDRDDLFFWRNRLRRTDKAE